MRLVSCNFVNAHKIVIKTIEHNIAFEFDQRSRYSTHDARAWKSDQYERLRDEDHYMLTMLSGKTRYIHLWSAPINNQELINKKIQLATQVIEANGICLLNLTTKKFNGVRTISGY